MIRKRMRCSRRSRRKTAAHNNEDATSEESLGTFAYQASGENGRKCSYLFGLYSRTFQRRVITP